MYTEYQIRAAFLKVIKQALSETHIVGFSVMARNPQVIVGADNVVLVDRLFTQRLGFQSRDYLPRLGSNFLTEREKWIDEITWQISILRKRNLEDNISTVTNNDVSKNLIWWLNSRHGAEAMRTRTDVPMAPVFVKQSNVSPYMDDNEIHQYTASFDVKTQVLQVAGFETPAVDITDIETYPI